MNRTASRNKRHSAAWYALRRTLPTWSFEENLNELVKRLPEYRVDEVVVKVDTEEFTHGQPPLKWVKKYQKNLFRIRDELKKLGVVYSINPWITVGHCDRGRDARKALPGLRTTVGHDGVECTCCACPLDPVWRGNMEKVWTLYAETEPAVMWIEDDIRTFNHAPVTYGCFCPLHMKRFSERVGRKVTREQLVKAILKPGKPHRWRKEYMDMQAEIMIETVSFISGIVHRTSPETCIGLMSSGARNHCIEGRRWEDFCEAMADGTRLYSRPPMGNYSESSMRGFYYSHDSIKLTRKMVPEGAVEQSEVENVPFTQYANSAAFTFMEIALSIAYGCEGVTLNLFDHSGTPMEYEPAFGKMLGSKKRFLNGLAKYAQTDGPFRGVQLLFNEDYSYHKRLPAGARYRNLSSDDTCMMTLLESHGIPTTYDNSPVVATSGQMLRTFTDEQIHNLLKGGMLIDATAACVLVERGFGDLIGIRSIEPPRCIDDIEVLSAEEFYNPDFGGKAGKYLTLTIPDLGGRPKLSLLKLKPRAEIISKTVNPDAKRRQVCMFAYENKLGGRVVVHAIDLASAFGSAFIHTFRREQLEGAIRYLSRNRVPLLVRGGVYPLAFRRDSKDYSLFGCFNLTLDPWPHVEFEFAEKRRAKRIELLDQSGRWRKSSNVKFRKRGPNAVLTYNKAFTYDSPVFVCVHWK